VQSFQLAEAPRPPPDAQWVPQRSGPTRLEFRISVQNARSRCCSSAPRCNAPIPERKTYTTVQALSVAIAALLTPGRRVPRGSGRFVVRSRPTLNRSSDRLDLEAEIEVFSLPEDQADHAEQVRIGAKLRQLAPRVWGSVVSPILCSYRLGRSSSKARIASRLAARSSSVLDVPMRRLVAADWVSTKCHWTPWLRY